MRTTSIAERLQAGYNSEILLSIQEQEVLRLIGEGKTSQEIGIHLYMKKTTVDNHRKNIMKKTNVYGKINLIKYASENQADF